MRLKKIAGFSGEKKEEMNTAERRRWGRVKAVGLQGNARSQNLRNGSRYREFTSFTETGTNFKPFTKTRRPVNRSD